MQQLGTVRQRIEALAQYGKELKTQESLRARKRYPSFGQHVVDAVRERGLFGQSMDHSRVPKTPVPAQELQPIPEGQSCHPEQRGNEQSGGFTEDPKHDDIKIDSQAEAEGKKRAARKDRRRAKQSKIELPAFGDAMASGGSDQATKGDSHQNQRGSIQPSCLLGQSIERRLEDSIELKAEEDLSPQHQQPGFVESHLELLLDVHRRVSAAKRNTRDIGAGVAACQFPTADGSPIALTLTLTSLAYPRLN